ncbi:hypothetical protein KM043_017187 [Ampulex compressa]|nr:hypothetical protein KM043_017187 [Ampulex compressa]
MFVNIELAEGNVDMFLECNGSRSGNGICSGRDETFLRDNVIERKRTGEANRSIEGPFGSFGKYLDGH